METIRKEVFTNSRTNEISDPSPDNKPCTSTTQNFTPMSLQIMGNGYLN